MLAQIASDKLFKKLDTIESGHLTITTPDGKTRVFAGQQEGETADIELHDWRVIKNLVTKGDIGFAEDYRDGNWHTSDLTALTTLSLNNRAALNRFVRGGKLSRFKAMLSYMMRLNSIKGSKKNIHAHYDLGNDFYSLWLDPSMTYSSALYKSEGENLEQAQYNKYDRILDCLGRDGGKNSGSLLEVGCGWGGFAERAQEKGDFNLKGLTLSEEQHDYATKRLQRYGQNANIALEDYRHQNSKYDHIVSIEMFEAVGEQYWRTYFDKISSLLEQKGKAVIQTITIDEQDFEHYRRGGDFIRSFIFPGGMLPSESRFVEEAKLSGLNASKPFYFGQNYADTLAQWLDNFDAKRSEVQALGFDDGFIRLWRFYLAACVAGFRTGRTDVMQVELAHA